MSDWNMRPFESQDTGGILYQWLRSFSHGRYGRKLGAHDEKSQASRDFWVSHRPVVLRLLGIANTQIICDPQAPEVIWGFACTQGDVVHYLSIKRKFYAEGFGPEMMRALLGDRLTKVCRYTHELVEFRRPEIQAAGLVVPSQWIEDPYILSTREAA